tara:strand:+ start:60 stop:587 length:528 start_codon:yes stop_codon:yes gene_type:complete
MLKLFKKRKSKEKTIVKNAEYYLSLFAHREMIERANSGNTLDYNDAIENLITEIENYEVDNQNLKIQIQNLCLQNNILTETQELNSFGFFIRYNKPLIKEIYIIRKIILLYRILLRYIYNIYNEILIYYYLTIEVIKEDIQYKKEFIKSFFITPPKYQRRTRLRALFTKFLSTDL